MRQDKLLETALTFSSSEQFPLCDKIAGTKKKLCKQLPPAITEEFFRKRYAVPATHYDPLFYPQMELMTILSSGMEKTVQTREGEWQVKAHSEGNTASKDMAWSQYLDSTDQLRVDPHFNAGIIDSVHRELRRLDYPTYFMDEQTFTMLSNAKMSNAIPLEEIVFPLPSFLISFPRSSKEKDHLLSDLCVLSITKTFEYRSNEGSWDFFPKSSDYLSEQCKPWSELKQELPSMGMSPAKGTMVPTLSVVGVLREGESIVGKFPIGGESVLEMLESHQNAFHADYKLAKRYESAESKDGSLARMELQLRDIEELNEAVKLAVKIICFMTSRRSEWDTASKIETPAKYKKGKLKREELWSANFIGKAYGDNLREQGYGQQGDKTGRKQRYHWRQAHIKGVWYGKNKSKYKTVLVDAYPVNHPENEHE